MWQELIVGVCVLGAVVFLLRRWAFPARKSSACGGCSSCDKTTDASCSNPAENGKY